MTQNQINYSKFLEDKRHNVAGELETNRHNIETEDQGRQTIAETKRHNVAGEVETKRHNTSVELETNRHNVRTEGQTDRQLAETERHNVAGELETNRHNVAVEYETNRSNVAREVETNRSNVARETETNRSNVAKETETNRHNTAVEFQDDKRIYMEQIKLPLQQLKTAAELGKIKSDTDLTDAKVEIAFYDKQLAEAKTVHEKIKAQQDYLQYILDKTTLPIAQKQKVATLYKTLSEWKLNETKESMTWVNGISGAISDLGNTIAKFK